MITRRFFTKLAFAAALQSRIKGVMVGAQSYSFRGMPFDEMLAGMNTVGLSYLEPWQGHWEPKGKEAEFRSHPDYDLLTAMRRKCDAASIEIYAVNISMRDDWSDEQIENAFKSALAFKVNRITASSNINTIPRIYPFCQKYKIPVAVHNHDSMQANEFSTPEDIAKARQGREDWIKINLDIGHFNNAGQDPVSYLEQHHSDIMTLHIKDSLGNHGGMVPFGQGQAKIKEVLRVVEKKHYPIPAMIEYEYGKPGMDTVAEMRKCFDYIKRCLRSD
jgi:sugar phosphate isomerase/epimerase